MPGHSKKRKNVNMSLELYNELEETKNMYVQEKGLSDYPTLYFLKDLLREKKQLIEEENERAQRDLNPAFVEAIHGPAVIA